METATRTRRKFILTSHCKVNRILPDGTPFSSEKNYNLGVYSSLKRARAKSGSYVDETIRTLGTGNEGCKISTRSDGDTTVVRMEESGNLVEYRFGIQRMDEDK